MKNLSKKFLVLLPAMSVLLLSYGLSCLGNFNWGAICFFVSLVTLGQILLYIKKPEKLLEPTLGWTVSGMFYSYLALPEELIVKEGLFDFIFLTSFAFTMLLLYIPNFRNKN